jgi:alpha-galactosidase
MVRATRYTLTAFTVSLLLAPLAAVRAEDAGRSVLVLDQNFRLADLRQMPRPASNHWRFEQRNYVSDNAVEWQLRLQAPASGDGRIYEAPRSADFVVRFPSEKGVTLHWSKGSHAEATDFQPRVESLTAGKPFALESFGGRSSDGVMPYFNLAGEGGGLIVAVGWSGDWKASFESLRGGSVQVTAGLKHSRLKLRAGEQVRLPSVLVMSYRGAWLDGQNQFRRLMLRYFTPRNHPPMDLMPVAASVHGIFGFNTTTEETLTALAAEIAALKLPLDTFWLDAGWNEGGFPHGQGNPNADPARFPRGLGPVGKSVRKEGMRFLTWFEPERAMRGTWLDREHSAWLYSPISTPPNLRYMEKDGFRLLDLGNADARNWALESISRHIREAGISVYRQDFNQYPAFFWHAEDPPDEVGRREVRHINGLYDFLDELARRHPGLILDNCASGGRRLDFEMMRRSVVLWRSDSCWDDKSFPRNVQAMTHGLSHWLPLHGLGAHTTDDVALRSGMGGCASYAVNYRDPGAVAALRKHLDRYLKVRPLFAADFYPLTEWSDDPAKWLAFQFHDPAKGEGIVQAFCGSDAPRRGHTLKLRGLDPNKRYTITDWDNLAAPTKRSGAELSNAGIEVRAQGVNRAVVLHYTSDS